MVNKLDNPEFYRSQEEEKIRNEFFEHFKECPIPDREILQNLGLFLTSKNLSRILFMNHIYQQIVDVHGVVIEFGTRWGQNISVFSALRGIYEPFNRNRKIIGFDTFTGFQNISEKDNPKCSLINEGSFSCTDNYEEYLEKVLEFQEKDNPLSHIKKFELRKGDATVEIEKYFSDHPETIVALAFFDLDIYVPTKKCLEVIKPHLVKGSLLAFDELNDADCPGETTALDEVLGLNNVRLKRYPFTSRISYFIYD